MDVKNLNKNANNCEICYNKQQKVEQLNEKRIELALVREALVL